MMQHASVGVRNATRKGSNTLVHHGGHNGPGGSTAANQFHTASFLQSALHAPHIPPLPSRNPFHNLFSTSKNFLQRFFTHLTAPGWRAPPYLTQAQNYSSRSLHGTFLRGTSIQSGLSLPVRNSLRNHTLQHQANTFLPRGPASASPRCGGVAQVGLGTARNFSTARPIFEHLIQNVPVAGRALYEIELDLGSKKHSRHMLPKTTPKSPKKTSKSKHKAQDSLLRHVIDVEGESEEIKASNSGIVQDDIEHYFPNVATPSVTTYLSIPLTPTPPTRNPLPPDLVYLPTLGSQESGLLPPLSFMASLHTMHSIHALRVATLFARLDQAAVWSRGGVLCSAYSEGLAHQRQDSKQQELGTEGVCTTLKIEFKGWSQNEVRSVIGESGIGWCTIEEVIDPEKSHEDISETDSLSSSNFDNISLLDDALHWGHYDSTYSPVVDPAESLIFPTVEISVDPLQSSSSFTHVQGEVLSNIPLEMESDPWADEYSTPELSSPYSSCSDLSDLIIDPPSINGWFAVSPSSPPGLGQGSPIYQSFIVVDSSA